jgi:alkyl sulfatase BDS1-like metallo-beta-lactamase superfamily hydrolase
MSLSMRPVDPSKVATKDPLELSDRVIDSGRVAEPTNRTINTLTEISADLSIIESFSHVYSFKTAEGMVCVDASGTTTATAVVGQLRSWSSDPVDHLIYTHGHLDHVGGSGAFAADAVSRGYRLPSVIGHEAVPARFRRYRDTSGYNTSINLRQFGGLPRSRSASAAMERPFLPEDVLWPTHTYADRFSINAGGLQMELHHGRGETDDHTWIWIPEHKALCVGDLMVWVFPNAGNPQKVQRYPLEWAAALREMQRYDAELLLPAHGLPIRGAHRIRQVLDDVATVLEEIVADTVAAMNAGLTLDEVLAEVTVRPEMMAKPWLAATYDEPEFVVHNIWRLYGGWWDQDPATLKPPPKASLAREVMNLAGGPEALVLRAEELAAQGDLRLACQLIEFAVQAEPDSARVHAVRAEIYAHRRTLESSLMSKGVFGAVARESTDRLGELG